MMQEKALMVEPTEPVWKMKRPLRVTLLAVYVFLVACWNGLRLGSAIFYWKTLAEYGSHPLYIAISGGVWFIAGLLLAWGLWRGKAWAWIAATGSAAGYGCWYWLDRLVLQKPHANWPFALIFTIVSLLFILLILFSRNTRRFFQRDTHERKYENPTTA
jgi:hypothetical protein